MEYSSSENGEHITGQVPRGPSLPGSLPGFLVQLCPPVPEKLFTLAPCQAGTGVRVCGRVRAFAPAPYSSQSHFAERWGPCEDQRAGLLARIPVPGAGLGHHAYVWGQWADFWDVGAGSQGGPEPSPCSEAQTGSKAWPRTVGGPAQDQARPWWVLVDRAAWGGRTWCEPLARTCCMWPGVSLARRASVSLSVGIRWVGAAGQRPFWPDQGRVSTDPLVLGIHVREHRLLMTNPI